jgi:phosphatidylserine decarboxylase
VNKHARSEAVGILIILGVAVIAALFLFPPAAVFLFGVILFVLYFFRDPERVTPSDPDLAFAPADGKVIAIRSGVESDYFQKRMVTITIFLSVFDVHVNRSPVSGTVLSSEGKKGLFLDARDPASSRKNASRLWIFDGPMGLVGVRQITGAIARRIVPWSVVGDVVAQGEKFGMIRFGSRTELIVPEGSKILVRVGTSVRAGVSPMVQLADPSLAASSIPHPDIAEGEVDPGL